MLEFKRVSIQYRDEIKKYLIESDNLCCELSFGNNILWDVDEKMEFAIVKSVLIYRMVYDEEITYCTPDFKGNIEQILELISEDAKALNRKYKITCLSANMVEQIKKILPEKYQFATDRAHSDYIYLVENLAKLSGKKYHKKKNHLNKFLKNYEFIYEEIDEENAKECIAMKNEWMDSRKEVNKTLTIESKAIEQALAEFDKFEFWGGLIRINGKVCAFTLGEQISYDTFVTHFEKALEGIDGLYAAINQQFALNTLLDKYKYVNREEDMGLEGLRQAKMTYNPEVIYDKYFLYEV